MRMEPLFTMIASNHDMCLRLLANAIKLRLTDDKWLSFRFFCTLALNCNFWALNRGDWCRGRNCNLRFLLSRFSLFLGSFTLFTVCCNLDIWILFFQLSLAWKSFRYLSLWTSYCDSSRAWGWNCDCLDFFLGLLFECVFIYVVIVLGFYRHA